MSPSRRARASIVVLVAATAALVLSPRAQAQESPADLEPVVVRLVEPDHGAVLVEGGSDTDFVLDLPERAACAGDSANDDYRLQSYMVPAGDERVDLAFDGLGPVPYSVASFEAFRQPLYDTTGEPFDVGLTAEADQPGDPGLILDVPTFDFTAYPEGTLPEGRYRIGLACTLHNEVRSIWETQIDVVADPEDDPAGIRWTVPQSPASSSDGPPVLLLLLAGAGALLAGGRLLNRRRRTPPVTTARRPA